MNPTNKTSIALSAALLGGSTPSVTLVRTLSTLQGWITARARFVRTHIPNQSAATRKAASQRRSAPPSPSASSYLAEALRAVGLCWSVGLHETLHGSEIPYPN